MTLGRLSIGTLALAWRVTAVSLTLLQPQKQWFPRSYRLNRLNSDCLGVSPDKIESDAHGYKSQVYVSWVYKH